MRRGKISIMLRKSWKLLPLVLASVIVCGPAFAERRVALVVGNAAYVNVPRLANSANDARLIADTMRSLGFTLVGGGAQIDLDETSFRGAVQDFGDQLQGADVGVFYYAGHGLQVRGANYLVPVSANPTKEADVDFQLLDSNLVLRQMESAGTKLNVVILDACRNNPFGGRGLRATDSGLAQMRAPEGTLISFATQPGSVAQDGADGHSPYTKALSAAMRKGGLGIYEAFNEVGLTVLSVTGGAQQPWLALSPIKGSFYFAGAPSSGGTQASQPQAQPPQAPPPQPAVDPAERAWTVTQNTASEAVLEDFIRQFGSTVYGSMARARLEELRKAKVAVVAPPPPAAIAPVRHADILKVNLEPNKRGAIADFRPMARFCGTKPIKVALSDGWGDNYWRHITRAEFEDEASKCPNITEARYIDGEFKPEKQIADIEGLIAQKFDVIVAFLDAGPAILKATREATAAGIAVVPYSVGENFPGVIGKDYVDRVTESQTWVGAQVAEWLVKTLHGKGNVVMFGGTPGNPMTLAQAAGWKPTFAKYPGIRLLELEPVPTNWDPAMAQQKTAALIAKHSQIDGFYTETTGPIRAFLAAGKPVPAFVGQSIMDLSCLAADNPEIRMASMDAHTWLVRLALRKAVAAAQGIDNDEPSLVALPFTEDTTSTDPRLAVKCDKSMPMDTVPSSLLTKKQQIRALGGH
jgi:ABC-type sugar transport system substrate-binding protein